MQALLFEIAHQLQRASPCGFAANDCATFLQLTYEAAQRARDSHAYEQAAGYLHTAQQLLEACSTLESRATLGFAIASMATECDLQLSRTVAAQARLAECRQRAGSTLERARVCQLQARLETLG